MYDQLLVNIYMFSIGPSRKELCCPKKQGGTLGSSKKIIKSFQKFIKSFQKILFYFFLWNRSIFTWKLKFIQC
jgi:hypothetical protein